MRQIFDFGFQVFLTLAVLFGLLGFAADAGPAAPVLQGGFFLFLFLMIGYGLARAISLAGRAGSAY